MADKKKFEEFLTPALEVTWGNVIKPNTNFKEDGEFQVSVKGTPEQMKSLQAQFDKAAAAGRVTEADRQKKPAILKYKLHNPVQPEVNKDSGEETGDMVLKTTASAVRKNKDKKTGVITKVPRTVQVVDAKLRPIKKEIGRGSIVRIAGILMPFAMANKEATVDGKKVGGIAGVSAKITMVQVLKLVEVGGAPDAASLGFQVEDGYDGAGDAEAASEADAPAEGGDASSTETDDSDF